MIQPSSIRGLTRQSRTYLLASLALCFAAFCGTAARADCQEDINKIMQRRMAALAQINGVAKKNGGKLDPISACPRLRSLVAVEAEGVTYFTKNQEWCNLPPDFVTKMTALHAKDAVFATRACTTAVQMKQQQKQQTQQAQEAMPKLPEGPL